MIDNAIIIFTIGAVAGLTIGMAVAGLILMKRKPHPWIVITRLSPWLHDKLRKSAKRSGASIGEEISNRLQTSFDRPDRHERSNSQGNGRGMDNVA
jgi:O-antigen/teichoic acid export membrane protein